MVRIWLMRRAPPCGGRFHRSGVPSRPLGDVGDESDDGRGADEGRGVAQFTQKVNVSNPYKAYVFIMLTQPIAVNWGF